MFGWMEVTELSEKVEVVRAVVPTIALPLAAVGLLLNALATFIAGLFGIHLKWEGPKRLLEVLLKPKVIFSAVVLNLAFYGGYRGYAYLSGYPAPLWRIQWMNQRNPDLSAPEFRNRLYSDTIPRINQLDFQASQGIKTRALMTPPSRIQQDWRVKLSKGVFGAVSLSGSSAFVGSDDGYTYELEQSNGKVLRRFYTGTEVSPEPVIWNYRLFIGEGIHTSHHSRVYSFDLKTGELLGTFQTQGHVEGTPVIAKNQGETSLFIMAGSDGVYSVDPLTLKEKWHRKVGHTDSEVRVEDGKVFFATGIEKGFSDRSHRAYALDFSTGQIIWFAELAASGWMPPVMAASEVCFGTGEIYADQKSKEAQWGQLACFDKRTGVATHAVDAESPLLGIPFRLGRNLMMVSSLRGEVCALRWPEGSQLWCHSTQGKTYASVTYDGSGGFFYPSAKDGLLLLDATTGKVMDSWLPKSSSGPSQKNSEGSWAQSYSRVTGGGGGWFLADSEGNVRKFSIRPQPSKNER